MDATPYLPPPGASMEDLAEAVQRCRGCPLWRGASQAERELDLLRPDALVALGATAAQGLLGRDFRATRQHGQLVESPLAPVVTATIHPSAILRARSDEDRRELRETMVEDLAAVARGLGRRFRAPARG